MSLHRDLVRKIKVIAIKQRCPYVIVVNLEQFPKAEIGMAAKGLSSLGIPVTFLMVNGDVRKAVAATAFDQELDGGQGEIVNITDNKEVK